ncbi:MAG: hypothetical protein JSV49_01485 [Thermoplasmata archaeon]|nr:MAG: hypothetical protein JSV49_01485 [Thermoplasmata archaeon]
MRPEESSYGLDANQIEQALAILGKEYQANVPSRPQKIFFKLLNICVYGAVIIFLMSIGLAGGLSAVFGIYSSPIDYAGYVSLFLLFLSPLLFLINVPYGIKLWRQSRLVRRIGLSHTLAPPWRAVRKKGRLRNILTLIVSYLGIVLILLGLTIGILVANVADWSDPGEIFAYLVLSPGIIMIGVTFLVIHYMRRGKERLETVIELQLSLSDYRDTAEEAESKQVKIPTEQYDQIAQIERAQINREREESILASFDNADLLEYSVQKSRSVRDELATISPDIRMVIEDQIQELMIEPQPPGVKRDSKTELLQLRVPNAPVEIYFGIDEEAHRIMISSVKQIDE